VMEVCGVPPVRILQNATRLKMFFDSSGNPRLVPNSRGKTRRPGAKDMQMVLRTSETKYVDFLSGCLQWDPRERFTPEDALQQEWILEGYARHAAAQRPPREEPASHREHASHGGGNSMASVPSQPSTKHSARHQHGKHSHRSQGMASTMSSFHQPSSNHQSASIHQSGGGAAQNSFVFPPLVTESQSGIPTSKHHKRSSNKETTSVAPSSTGGGSGMLGAASGGGIGGMSFPTLPQGFPQDVSALQLEVLGISGLTGYTTGYAIKKAFKVLVFTSGVIAMGLQALASNGLITVHWGEIEKRIKTTLDLDKDGKFDAKDLQLGSDKMQAYLSAGLPSAGSFSAGFLMGMRA